MTGGTINRLITMKASTFNMSGGTVGYGGYPTFSYNSSVLNLTGGTLDHINSYGESIVIISGSTNISSGCTVNDSSHLTISGTATTAGIHLVGDSRLTITGGTASSVNVYDGDFGLVNIIPTLFNNRTSGSNTIDDDWGYLIDPDLIGLMVLKAEGNTELENQGGGRRGYTDVIAGLACFNPLGFGVFG